MVINGVNFPDDQIAEFCRRHGVQRLSLFGSILRDPTAPEGHGFRTTSDVDLLVEFLPGQTKSLLDIGGMLMELRRMLGREVDLRTPEDLSRYFRQDVLRHARPLYAA
ncbi:MAG: nucleotidyltransferase domain-containing protein [Phycisphaerales bacterium]